MYNYHLPKNILPPLGLSLSFHPFVPNQFIVDAIHYTGDGSLKWFHYIENNKFIEFSLLSDGLLYLKKHNGAMLENITALNISSSEESNIKLKVSKAISCKTRLTEEEDLMLRIAKKMKHSKSIPSKNAITLEHESFREPLFEILSNTPYVSVAAIPKYGAFLKKVSETEWKHVSKSTKKNIELFHRAKICEGFDLNPNEHWGKNKALIRKMLLPRANQLLQLMSVKRMLSKALENEQKVLVWGNHVFWYEESILQWEVKIVGDRYDNLNAKNTLWVEGTIISKNHGRLIVLPYIKSDGTKVSGYTKNAPHDEKSIARSPDGYVELPFSCIDGDLMYGLLGDLRYE
ncbi:hypothetical protein ABMY12_05690 [Vibrio vulnificus]|uniref:hypothetical protein n=1 Tax=Vibrio vulnificus TaxID=672 RepID=UPI0040590E34